MSWMSALDHTHYSRWLPVFVHTLKELPVKHPTFWNEFKKGHFTSRRTRRPFSSVSDDQMHEQNNTIVKTDGGPIGLYDNPDALLIWMVSSPEVGRMLSQYEHTANIACAHEDDDIKHHEDTDSFEKRFERDTQLVADIIQDNGNPFEEQSNSLVSMISKRIMDDEGSNL